MVGARVTAGYVGTGVGNGAGSDPVPAFLRYGRPTNQIAAATTATITRMPAMRRTGTGFAGTGDGTRGGRTGTGSTGAGEAGGCPAGAPQFSQNFEPGGISSPHEVQNAMYITIAM